MQHKEPQIDWGKISKIDTAYMAGIIDADGCISVNTTRYYTYWRITINNTSKSLMDWIEDKFGVGGVNKERRKRPKNHKRVYVFLVAAQKEVLEMVKKIEPYLIVKKQKAQECIEFLEEKFSGNFTSDAEGYGYYKGFRIGDVEERFK